MSVKAESSPPPHFQGGGCISEDRRRARALLPSLVLERGLRYRVPHTVLDRAQKKHNGPRHGRLGRRQGGLRSLLERGELVEGVPEQRRLPLGLRQGEHLLLRDAGGHGDVALVQGVQRLVRRGHGAPAVA